MNDFLTIRIEQVRVLGRHGVYAREQTIAQPFEVEVAIRLPAWRNLHDRLDDTVDYAAVSQCIRQNVEQQTFQLIESLADHLINEIAKLAPKALRVELTIRKPNAMAQPEHGLPSVTLSRDMGDPE